MCSINQSHKSSWRECTWLKHSSSSACVCEKERKNRSKYIYRIQKYYFNESGEPNNRSLSLCELFIKLFFIAFINARIHFVFYVNVLHGIYFMCMKTMATKIRRILPYVKKRFLTYILVRWVTEATLLIYSTIYTLWM